MSEVRGEVMPTYGSLFAGVGGFDMGFDRAGYDCRFQVEWDKNCQNILNRHWPDVPKWWDVSEVNGAELPPVDVLIFGSPCQDLSVAGKRAGLDGARSGLFYEAMRIIKEMRNATANTFPRVVVWENVVGALNSNGGADFGAVLNQMAEAGALVVEWAVLDAQHFGVPQRRRRVFVVAVLDPASAGRCPDPLLPVRESVRGDSAKGRKKGQATPGEAGGGVAVCDGQPTVMACIEATDARKWGSSQWVDNHKMVVQPIAFPPGTMVRLGGGVWEGGPVPTLRAEVKRGDNEPHVAQPYVKSRRAQSAEDDETWVDGKVANTLNQFDTGDTRTTTAIVQPLSFDTQFGSNANVFADQSPTLKSTQQSPSVLQYDGYNQRAYEDDVSVTVRIGRDSSDCIMQPGHVVAPNLTASNDPSRSPQSSEVTQQVAAVYAASMIVRRLTPVECERLMGWPDDHTRWTADGKEQADTHRYRQCGNGVATPVAQWIAGHLLPVLDVPLPVAE